MHLGGHIANFDSMQVIGLSGLAGSGKDLFFNLAEKALSEDGMSCSRYSLGDILKSETKQFILDNYDIDILNCSREEKDSVRPFLVAHGSVLRKQTRGRYFLDKMNKALYSNQDLPSVLFITDIRYSEYERDEVFWLKNELKGKLIHIKQFQLITNKYGLQRHSYIAPPNDAERTQDPIIQEQADEFIVWQKVDKTQVDKVLMPTVKDCLKKVLDYSVK